MTTHEPTRQFDYADTMFRGSLFVSDVPERQSHDGLYMQDTTRDLDDPHLMLVLNVGKTGIVFEPTHEQVKDIRDYMDRWLGFYGTAGE